MKPNVTAKRVSGVIDPLGPRLKDLPATIAAQDILTSGTCNEGLLNQQEQNECKVNRDLAGWAEGKVFTAQN